MDPSISFPNFNKLEYIFNMNNFTFLICVN